MPSNSNRQPAIFLPHGGGPCFFIDWTWGPADTWHNWQAREINTGAEAREGLYYQIPNSVRWSETILLLASKGVTRFIEVGAGSVLTGLVRNIDPTATALKFGEAQDWEKFLAADGRG